MTHYLVKSDVPISHSGIQNLSDVLRWVVEKKDAITLRGDNKSVIIIC
jgi:hypothetical protein